MANIVSAKTPIVRGAARAGRGSISLVGHGDVLVSQVELQYQQEVQPQPMGSGEAFVIVGLAQGALNIGAIAGPGVDDLLADAGDLGALLSQEAFDNGDVSNTELDAQEALVLNLEDPDIVADTDWIHTGETEYTIKNYLVQNYQLSNDPNQPPIATQVQIFCLDIENGAGTTTGG